MGLSSITGFGDGDPKPEKKKLPKGRIDYKAIARDQKAINALPNRGLASVNHGAKSKALSKKSESWPQERRRLINDAKKQGKTLGDWEI